MAYKVFLDSGYALGNTFITPFSRRRQLTPQEIGFNRYNANVRCFSLVQAVFGGPRKLILYGLTKNKF